MLHKAAVLANHAHIDRITTETFKEQLKADRETRIASAIEQLTKDHQILYGIVKQKRQILSRDLWQAYLKRCERIKRKPLAPRTFSEHANQLVQLNLVRVERARVKGKVRLFKIVT